MEGGNHRSPVKIMIEARERAPRTLAGGAEGCLKFCWPSDHPLCGQEVLIKGDIVSSSSVPLRHVF